MATRNHSRSRSRSPMPDLVTGMNKLTVKDRTDPVEDVLKDMARTWYQGRFWTWHNEQWWTKWPEEDAEGTCIGTKWYTWSYWCYRGWYKSQGPDFSIQLVLVL